MRQVQRDRNLLQPSIVIFRRSADRKLKEAWRKPRLPFGSHMTGVAGGEPLARFIEKSRFRDGTSGNLDELGLIDQESNEVIRSASDGIEFASKFGEPRLGKGNVPTDPRSGGLGSWRTPGFA